MSLVAKLFPVRFFAPCLVLLLAACGGNPSVTDNNPQGNAGTTAGGGTSNGGPDGGTIIGAAGDDNLGPLGPPTLDAGSGGSGNQSTPGCGDGTQDVGEACDDSNQQSGDGCSDQCLIEPGYLCDGTGCFECGNGVLESTEDCDDGNPDIGDGCSNLCAVEPGGFYCPVPGEPCELCGDGVLDPNETCDDGNTDALDGCAADCASIEQNFNCTTAGDPCELCGDGVVIAPEVCDDSNNINGDGCRFDCLAIEAGWLCDSNGCAYCGNGVDEPGEACDDGNQDSNDGCADDCNSVEAGFNCPVAGAQCEECGNGIKESTETCDDGDQSGGDGCAANCGSIETGWVCPVPGEDCGLCGNGTIEPNEICDDGKQCSDATPCLADTDCATGTCTTRSGDGCDNLCTTREANFQCPTPGTACEECGDGTKDANEACDDGNVSNGDGCRWDCDAIETGWVCLVGVDCSNCGNGDIEGNEVCDDGDEQSGDGCNATCTVEEDGFDCVSEGTACEECGNGIKESSELCDDGGKCVGGTNVGANCVSDVTCAGGGQCTAVDDDGCSDFCKTVDPGFVCHVQGAACEQCGDGVISANEVCDDGRRCTGGANNGLTCANAGQCPGGSCGPFAGDGCNATCSQVEPFFRCPTPGAVCLKCGDSVVQAPEVCDDGNNASSDGCRADCKVIETGFVCPGGGPCSLCSNGVLDDDPPQNETCDDSNAISGDGCSATCQEEGAPFNCFTDGVACDRCGNGVREASEACDDGGKCANGTNNGVVCDSDTDCTGGGDCLPVASDGCGATCQVEMGWVCPVPGLPCGLCGNGTVEQNEICDDGKHCIGGTNNGSSCTIAGNCPMGVCEPRSGDGCDDVCSEIEANYTCQTPGQPCERCGDSNTAAPEVCDDGNTVGGDGCSFNCRVEENGFSCPPFGGPCTSCGNGSVEAPEECDDGNSQANDGCSDTCVEELGYSCEVEGALCYRCGNGVKEGSETCDDGDAVGSDGCSSVCQTEVGWTCPVAGADCGNCGNGTIEEIEICDDGRQCVGGANIGQQCTSDGNCPGSTCAVGSGDGCNATCTAIEANHRCLTPGQPCIECGDGVVQVGEVCDDGDAVGGDGCNFDCTVEEDGFDCVTPGQACLECGNGNIEGSEVCDDTNRQSGDGCSATCTVEANYECPPNGHVAEGQLCQRCGNGAVESLEQCDDGTQCVGGVNIGLSCTSSAQCPGSTCAPRSGDGCTATCDLQGGGWICPYPGQPCELCGDGTATSSEICDDGRKCVGGGDAGEICVTGTTCLSGVCSPVSNDGCASDCQTVEDFYDCPINGGACDYTVECGDGRIAQGIEQCEDDDVTPTSGDGCSATCTLEPGYFCSLGQACTLIPFCGDGLQAGNELCDDGGTCVGGARNNLHCNPQNVNELCPGGTCTPQANDGCNATCTAVEPNYACPTPGVACTNVTVTCGDGVLGGTEACDDGKRCVGGTNAGAVCTSSATCTGGGTCSALAGNLVCYGGVDNDMTCDADNDCAATTGSITYVGVNTYTSTATTLSQSVTLTSPADTQRMVVVAIGGQAGGTRSVSSITLGGVAMHATQAANVTNNGNTNFAFLYYLGEAELPDPGARTLAVTLSGTVAEAIYHVMQLTGVADQAPEAMNNSTGTASTTISTTITTLTAGAWIVSSVTNDDQGHNFTPTTGQTERADGGVTAARGAIGTRQKDTPGLTTETWTTTQSNVRLAQVLAAFKPGPGVTHCQSEGGDGCSNSCQLDPGWVCPLPNTSCFADDCGDGLLAGGEQCEANLTIPADACLSDCTVDPDYACEWDAIAHETNCALIATACDNDGNEELGEPCDDGNNEVNDGCSPLCEVRPDCPKAGGACNSQCGDGIILPADAETCDDGNDTNGDGCSQACVEESGFECTITQGTLPATITIPFVYRDFIALPSQTTTLQRHPDFESRCMSSQQDGLVNTTLDVDGKPTNTGTCNLPAGCAIDVDYTAGAGCGTVRETCDGACGCNGCEGQTHGLHAISGHPGDPFAFWYRDETNVSFEKAVAVTLTKDVTDKYTFNPGTLFPLDDDGWVASGDELEDGGHNYGFTSEVRYWFEYQGGEILTFAGDDDVWVFVNGRLALDLGGIHGSETRTIRLEANGTASCKIGEPGAQTFDQLTNCATASRNIATTVGSVYEIALFHAERHTTASNFRLSITGFVQAKSNCVPDCGDGVVRGSEQCDDGDSGPLPNNANGYGTCQLNCTLGAFCGDGNHDVGNEACDNGFNQDGYNSTAVNKCAPGCVLPPRCGDGTVNSQFGETCDGINDGGYGHCTAACQMGPRCGDGIENGTEECDDGVNDATQGCAPGCLLVPECGDGVVQVSNDEECDDGNTTSGDNCSNTCQFEFICGNGTVNPGEQCDDGNVQSGDGCNSTCETEFCGDGTTQVNPPTPEQCDDGNTASNDGCSATCQLENECGDNTVDPGEQCDDDNTANGDGCSATCQNEVCGDGILQVGQGEQCDDGNTVSGDGCSKTCFSEFECGNGGIPEGLEQCDDGNNISGDGCSATCLNEVCGDGITQSAPPTPEQCDDGCGGNGCTIADNGDGCSSTCQREVVCGNGIVEGTEQCDDGCGGNGCTVADNGDGCSSTCLSEVVCGDGVREGNEQCDDDNTTPGDGCNAICRIEFCGDGVEQPLRNETCDDGGNVSGDGCTATCQDEFCGDGTKQPSEQCDNGRRCVGGNNANAVCTANPAICTGGGTCSPVSGDGCSATCITEPPACGNDLLEGDEECDGEPNCSPTCTLQVCGNGDPMDPLAELDPGEACDDGNTTSGDGCSNTCQSEAFCGDGDEAPSEQCDDGNNSSGDGCSSTCIDEVCGDGTRQPALNESCDDGNTMNDDGCSATCTLETACGNGTVEGVEQCDTSPNLPDDGCSALCQLEVCGNGSPQNPLLQLDPGEDCDDGNTTSGDGCSNDCELETICGNMVVTPPEQCDDGNNVSGDNCSSTCRIEGCGDGITQPARGEQCDDGGTTSGNGCSATCQLETACGNNIVEGAETCDDGCGGNGCTVADNGDGCSSICRVEGCGDSVQQPGETCDDGDTQSGDGCSSTCQAEVYCGDGEQNQTSEQCDDDNNVSGDGCSSTCKDEVCGDGITQAPLGEQCDDDNTAVGDGCRNDCTREVCGDGIEDPDEECDDGNTNNSDQCTSLCQDAQIIQ